MKIRLLKLLAQWHTICIWDNTEKVKKHKDKIDAIAEKIYTLQGKKFDKENYKIEF